MGTEMTTAEKNLRALAKLVGLNVRTVRSCGTFEISLGEGPEWDGSYGINSVIRYTAWNDTYTVPGFHSPGISQKDVAAFLMIWKNNRRESKRHLEYLLRRGVAA